MASGHVNRANKAEHMAAPHRYLRREDFPCRFGAVHTWPFAMLNLHGWDEAESPDLGEAAQRPNSLVRKASRCIR